MNESFDESQSERDWTCGVMLEGAGECSSTEEQDGLLIDEREDESVSLDSE